MRDFYPLPLDKLIVHHFNWTESTQSEAKTLFANGELIHGTSIIADQQLAGYGKNGREWFTSKGNVAMTICLEMRGLENWEQLCYVAAVSVGNTLRKILQQKRLDKVEVAYKWVNDVMIEDGKVAGVLLESLQNRFILVGIGVNNQNAPEIQGVKTTYLAQYIQLSTEKLIDMLHNEFMEQYTAWVQYGFTPLRNQWLEHPYKFREVIQVRQPHSNKIYKGIFIGIDREGSLELKDDHDNLLRITMGEVL